MWSIQTLVFVVGFDFENGHANAQNHSTRIISNASFERSLAIRVSVSFFKAWNTEANHV